MGPLIILAIIAASVGGLTLTGGVVVAIVKVHKIWQENQELKRQAKELKPLNDEARENLQKFNSDANRVERDITAIESELEELREDKEAWGGERRGYEKRIKELEETITDLNKRLAEFQQSSMFIRNGVLSQ